MERIDAYAHALPEPFHDALGASDVVGTLGGSMNWLWDVERFKADMADLGVNTLVLALALPPIWKGLDPAATHSASACDSSAARRSSGSAIARSPSTGTHARCS